MVTPEERRLRRNLAETYAFFLISHDGESTDSIRKAGLEGWVIDAHGVGLPILPMLAYDEILTLRPGPSGSATDWAAQKQLEEWRMEWGSNVMCFLVPNRDKLHSDRDFVFAPVPLWMFLDSVNTTMLGTQYDKAMREGNTPRADTFAAAYLIRTGGTYPNSGQEHPAG